MKKRTSIFYLPLELEACALKMDTNVNTIVVGGMNLLLNFKEGVATHEHEVDAAPSGPKVYRLAVHFTARKDLRSTVNGCAHSR